MNEHAVTVSVKDRRQLRGWVRELFDRLGWEPARDGKGPP